MNFEIDPDDEKFLQVFREFCIKEIQPKVSQAEGNGELPRSHFNKLYDVGYNGLLHKEEFGGSNSSYVQAMLAQEILAEYCGSTFFSVGASVGLFGLPLSEYGNEEQKKKYLVDTIQGKKIGCLAVTEPDAGSDVSALKCTAKKSGNDYILNGQKAYITNAPICDYILALANLIDENGKEIGLTSFVFEADRKGITRGKKLAKMGLRGSPTGEIFFEDVRLTHEDILWKPGKGFKITMEAFNRERVSLAAYSVGTMAACFADCKAYAKQRKSFGRPISKHQSVAFMLSDILVKYESARIVLHEAAWMLDNFSDMKSRDKGVTHNGYPVDLTAKMATAKLLASTHAREVANLAVQIHGGAGYMDEYRVSRIYRDVKLAEIGGGTSEIQKQIIARSEKRRVG
ncbi:MAG: acyl-CoA dehydrogenase family protein [Leptospiraceae bacterium]|nr:acyl-CoA dehydrogenase family protein [Leptospiraceae bacterium]